MKSFGAEPGLEISLDHRIGRDDLADNPTEQGGAGPNQYRKAIEQRHDHRGAGYDQRNADGKTDHKQCHVAFGGSRNRDHVVEAHDYIGNGDDLNRPPEMLGCLGLVLVRLLRHQQLGCYIKQGEPAHDLQPWQQHQRRHENGEHDA